LLEDAENLLSEKAVESGGKGAPAATLVDGLGRQAEAAHVGKGEAVVEAEAHPEDQLGGGPKVEAVAMAD
jgi:hypothetical protein